jgi:4-phosphopantoate--beta-alanine ligase
MRVPKRHPRYRSLKVREHLSRLSDAGVVSTTGLIAHGRGEAFDYFLGERTSPEAENAAIAAAFALISAERPVLSVNGNVAALAGREMVALSQAIPAPIEINLFHRSPERLRRVAAHMESLGARDLLGLDARMKVPGLPQPRAWCSKKGIFTSDVVLVPLEDGDRAEALRRMGKFIVTIDLNPMSRTALSADITIVDELTRAIPILTGHVRKARRNPEGYGAAAERFDNEANIAAVRKRMADNLSGSKRH